MLTTSTSPELTTSASPGKAIYQLVLEARKRARRDCRADVRFPFFQPVSIHIDGRQYSAFSRDLAKNGIGLVHSFDLPCNEVVISIREGEYAVNVRTKIVCCQPCGEGWYLSGGEFVGLSVTQ